MDTPETPPTPKPPVMPEADLSAWPDPLGAGVPLLERFKRLWVMAQAAVDVRIAALMCFCGGWLVFTQIHCTIVAYDRDIRPLIKDWNPYAKPMFGHLYWFWMGPPMLFVVPLLVSRLLLGVHPRDLGVQLGNWRSGLRWVFGIYAGFLPVVVVASFFATFKNMYPMNGWMGDETVKFLAGKGGNWWPFLLFEASYGFYFVGWEFFFRGMMGFALYRVMGWYGVFVATIPFAVMHVGKPEPEALGSVVAGVALGVFAIKERSFLYGALLHALVAWTMDVLAIFHRWRDMTGK